MERDVVVLSKALDRCELTYDRVHTNYTKDVIVSRYDTQTKIWDMTLRWSHVQFQDPAMIEHAYHEMRTRFDVDAEDMALLGGQEPSIAGLLNQDLPIYQTPSWVDPDLYPMAVATISHLLTQATPRGQREVEIEIRIPCQVYAQMVTTQAPFSFLAANQLEMFITDLTAALRYRLTLREYPIDIDINVFPTRHLKEYAAIYFRKDVTLPLNLPIRGPVMQLEDESFIVSYIGRLGELQVARADSILYFEC